MSSANAIAPTGKWALIAGAGQGLGQSLLTRFASEGLIVVGLGRTSLQDCAGEFFEVDLANADAVNKVIEDLHGKFGPPNLVVHNAAELVIEPFAKTEPALFEQTWKSMVQSLVILGQAVLEPMARGDGGTLLVSGATASLRGSANFSAFASAKFAVRGLTQSLAREYQSQGVHVCHVILDGIIDTKRSRELHTLDPARMMAPEDIAEVYWQLAQQPKSTWSHELDLRPASERF